MKKGSYETDRDKMVIERLYTKIDYLKNARLRVPAFVAVANFGLVTLSTRAKSSDSAEVLFSIGFGLIALVGLSTMFVIKRTFDGNVRELKKYYAKIGIDPDQAEPATIIWLLLVALIIIASALPVSLLLMVDFIPTSHSGT
ncbi:hypothetical protein [Roseibium sp.]|uniref:hypothetical protein n=1 Tax=Roseibium sp. TaxID=1936156 RepID=UPI003A979D84